MATRMHSDPAVFARLIELYAEGEAAVAQGNFDRAVERFSEILSIDDQFRQRYVTAYAQRGFALQRLGRLAEALTDLEKAIEMEPPMNQAQYHFHAGMCQSGLGAKEEAVAAYGRSIALHDAHPGPYHLRAQILVEDLGRYAEALQDLDRLIALAPKPDAYSLRGMARHMTGNHEGAIEDWNVANEAAPHPYYAYMSACAAAKLEDEESMYEYIEAAIEGDASYRDEFRKAAEFEPYREDEEFEEALAE